MRIKNNKLKLLIIVLILFICSFFAAINNTLGIYKSNLNTTINLTVLDPSTNYVITFDENYTGGDSWDVVKAYNEQLGTDYTVPTRTGYNFLGWYTQDGTKIEPTTPATANITYYAHWAKIVCKKVTDPDALHTETCATGGPCLQHGYTAGSTITYGTIPGQNGPVAGDAYDCDVNNNNTFDPATERFYFVRGTTGNDQKAILVHYTSFDENGQMDSSSSRNNYTYDAGKTWLPGQTVWSNPALTTIDGKVSRYINHDDLAAACGDPVVYGSSAYLSTCQFFLENSRYQSKSLGRAGIWIEKLNDTLYRIHTQSLEVQQPSDSSSANTVRPVIEIPMNTLEGYHDTEAYTISFNTHGGSSVASVTRYAGETLGTIVTTRDHYDFDGWYANFENDVYSNPVTASTVITGNMTLHAKWTPRITHTVTFDANGGTINGENTFNLIVDDGSTVSADDLDEISENTIYEGKDLDGWYIQGAQLIPFTSSTVVTGDLTVIAVWNTAHYVAKIGNNKYETLADAISQVPTTGVKTRVTILDNISLDEKIAISSSKWVELDIGAYTIDSANFTTQNKRVEDNLFYNNGKLDIISGTISSTDPYIVYNLPTGTLNISGGTLTYNKSNSTEYKPIQNVGGTVNITGGKITSNSRAAVINNLNSTGVLNVSGGEIIATNSGVKGQAIYMEEGPTTTISGTAYLESSSPGSGDNARATVDNTNGTLIITGGTIVSKNYNAVMSRLGTNNTVTIGIDDENIDTTTPVLRGKKYGLEIAADGGTASVYDGIFESLDNTTAISSATTITKPSAFINDSTVIDGVTYYTTYLQQPDYTVTFHPENGGANKVITVTNGSAIGNLMPQDPTKSGYYFDGWYDNNKLITATTVVRSTFDAYAKWVQSVVNATITATNDSFTIEVGSTEQISFVQSDIESVTYLSNNDNIATVDTNGQITATGIGSTTITLTGLKSGQTRTVSVTVTPVMHTVTFLDADGITPIGTPQTIADNTSFNDGGRSLPNPTDEDYVIGGWYINDVNLTPFTASTKVTGDITVIAIWKEKIGYATLSTSPNPFELIIGGDSGTIALIPTDQNGVVEEYTLTSSDDTIASIGNNNTVVGVGVGTTNIIVTGDLSGDTFPVSVTVDVLKYTVTFDPDNGNNPTTVRIAAGETIGANNIPQTNPEKTDYIFDGWFIDGDRMNPISSEITVNGPIMVVACWTPSIRLATIPSTLSVIIGGTKTISVTPVTGMESYTFAMQNNDTTYASVNSSTGEVTAGNQLGTATVVITGSRSNYTKTVTVTVTDVTHTVTFLDDDGETELYSLSIVDNGSFGDTLPTPTRSDYYFNGWHIDDVNLTPFTGSVVVSGDMTVIASWISKVGIATITTNPDPMKIRLGDTGQITLTGPHGELVENYTLTSSDSNTAEVNANGIVNAVDIGTATITITGTTSNDIRTVQVIVHNNRIITFDPDNGNDPTEIEVPYGSSINASNVTLPNDPTKTDYIFDRWYYYDDANTTLTTTPLDEDKIITQDETYVARWAGDSMVVAIGTDYYDALYKAILAAPGGVETEIRVLKDYPNITCTSNTNTKAACDSTGRTTVPQGKNIVINGGNHTVSCGNSTNGNVIYNNKGILTIKSGTFDCSVKAGIAPLENASGGTLNIEGGTITNGNNRGAIYNSGILNISGGNISTGPTVTIRSTIQNNSGASFTMTGGTVTQEATTYTSESRGDGRGAIKFLSGVNKATITGGTITSLSTTSGAIYNASASGKLVIGTDDDENSVIDTYDITSPVIQGEYYGVDSSTNYSLYDGIIKGKYNNQAVNDVTKITGKETGATIQTGTDGSYTTLYCTIAQTKYIINYNAGEGTVNRPYDEFNLNTEITASALATATPVSNQWQFDGWYTDPELEHAFAPFIPTEAASVTYYAKYTFISSLTPVSHAINSNAINQYFSNVSSWVLADADDPSNDDDDVNNDNNNGHNMFKSSINSVFTSNNCSACEGANKCNSPEQNKTYCDQPQGYNTTLSDDLNVYLYENGEPGNTIVPYITSEDGIIYNMIPGVTYYWVSQTDNTKYGVVTATGERRTLKTDVRNLRDLGGMTVTYTDLDTNQLVTGTINYGRLYRGAEIKTTQGVTDLTKLGITREIDLRPDTEGSAKDNNNLRMTNFDIGTKTSHQDIVMTNYLVNPEATTYLTVAHYNDYINVKKAMREVMKYVVDPNNPENIFFHCTIGTDRTGTLAYFLEGLLGVSEEDRLRDYEMTYFFGLTNRMRFHDYLDGSGINPRFYSMYRSYPSNAAIYNYYKAVDVRTDPANEISDDDLLTAFRNAMIKKNT